MNLATRPLLAATLGLAAATAQAQPWQLQQLILPPFETAQQINAYAGFGRTVALSGDWLAVGVPFWQCSGGPPGAVLMYRLGSDHQYRHVQTLCNVGPGTSIAIDGDSMVVGWSHYDATPGDDLYTGRVSFLRWNPALQHWAIAGIRDGYATGLLGSSVAMRNGVVIAGESGYGQGHGRIRSWRWAGAFVIEETPVLPPQVPFPIRPGNEPEGFGSQVDLDLRGCVGDCSEPLDALVTLGRSGVYTAARTSAGWGPLALKKPLRGTKTAFSDIAINDSLVVTTMQMFGDDPDSPCATDIWRTEVRLLQRLPGSENLREIGILCRDQMPFGPGPQFVNEVELDDRGPVFHFSLPDEPALMEGVVSTWAMDVRGRPELVDALVDPDLVTVRWEETGLFAYNPDFAGDYFGDGLAIDGDRMAIGAPMRNALLSTLGSGYVVIYRR